MNTLTHSNPPMAGQAPNPEAVEGRLALRLTAHLSRGTQTLPHDITERLRFGRERALASRRASTVAAVAPAVVHIGAAAALGGSPSWWLRLVSAVPLVVLVAGLVFIQHHHDLQQISVAAEIDSALLADELPPAAYGDPGFSEFLRSGEAP